MKFKSRKDRLFQVVLFVVSTLFCGNVLYRVISNGSIADTLIWTDGFALLVVGLLFWLYFGTEYELTPKEFRYKSGPLRGAIALERITEIIQGKSLWSGLKPATARNGLIIKYDQHEEVYISPETNEAFIEKILEWNPTIKITVKENHDKTPS